MHKSFTNSFILFILIIISSCSFRQNSTLIDNPCEVPCWQGIIPGETDYDESFDLLNRFLPLKITDTANYRNLSAEDVNEIKFSLRNQRETAGLIKFINGKVKFIQISSKNWTASEIVKTFGEPDSYTSSLVQLESKYRSVMLFYKNGIVVTIQPDSYNKETNNSIITEHSKVSVITFFKKYSDYSALGEYTEGVFLDDIHPWVGFGELDTYKSN